MRSHAILRTNVGLTTNVKLMVGSTYSLYLDSINSNSQLSNSKLKKMEFNKDNYWDELVPYFFKGIPSDTAYFVKYDDDNDNMLVDFSNQYDDLYNYGARNIIDNKDYSEEYEYFAPLHINKNSLPKNFIIFRIDGPGLESINKDNFNSQIINKLKCVKIFDLTRKTPLGEWLEKNITGNKSFPDSPIYMDFRRLEFSSWNGIDFEDGGYSEKSFMMDRTLEFEMGFHEFQKLIYDGFKNNKIIFPHIINFSFLFDDTPATPTSIRKWSLNRYMGFYLDDLEFVLNVSPSSVPTLVGDVIIDSNNILYSPTHPSPFLDTGKTFKELYVELGGEFYKVEKIIETQQNKLQKVQTSSNTYEEKPIDYATTKYKIISNISLTGRQTELNKNIIYISKYGKITYSNGDPFHINGFDDADVWLIEINGLYHNIKRGDDSGLTIYSDWAFDVSSEKFDYYINDPDPNYRKSISINIETNGFPTKFGIWKCKFTDIKDFDYDIVDTQYSKFEYIKETELTNTDETKMYTTNLESVSNPKDFNDYKINGTVVNIPCSSEYTATGETFQILNNDLTDLWRKNPIGVKWGFKNSISSNDYPYLLNNSIIGEDYNRTTNPFDPSPHRHERNLDYFLTINANSNEYLYHSLHVTDSSNEFSIDKYLGLNWEWDYFSHFFGQKSEFNSGKLVVPTKKWSYFNNSDNIIPNITLFRGLKFKIFDVDGVKVTDGKIETINIKSSNKYDDWKFTILTSKNNWSVLPSANNPNIGSATLSENSLRWKTIDIWKHDKIYRKDDIVLVNDVLWSALTQSQIIDPMINPTNSNDWVPFSGIDGFNDLSIFWSRSIDEFPYVNNFEGSNPLVYYDGDYYYRDSFQSNDIEYVGRGNDVGNLVNRAGFKTINDHNLSVGDVVSIVTNNPQYDGLHKVILTSASDGSYPNSYFVTETEFKSPIPPNTGTTGYFVKWNIVELWRSDRTYSSNEYVVYNNVVYLSKENQLVGKSPDLDSNWGRIYSLVPDTNYIYGSSINSNNIIHMNNRYYLCVSNRNKSTLDNGIVIYINKKWKNVLVNIYVNDNTYSEVEFDGTSWNVVDNKLCNTNRDDLYNDMFSKLTANNVMNVINDSSNYYDFSDKLKYVIINEDSSLGIYEFSNLNSIHNLPVLMTCEGPDGFLTRINSLKKQSVSLKESEIKPRRKLDDGNIVTIDQLNWVSDGHLATEIDRVTEDPINVPNYSSLKNQLFNSIWRHSGNYSPIFNDIQLFESPGLTGSYGNWKFDTTYNDFGVIKERHISKVNRNSNILKLRNNPNLKSIYPMLDEFGYHSTKSFIFKSTWDFEYHVECLEVPQVPPVISNSSLSVKTNQNNTNNNNLSQL